MRKPLMIDLFAGLGGWAEGGLAEGYYVVGFDNERHVYGDHRYPGHLVIQDVLTLHGSQFRNAALIVASPPCQAYSYRAMPWKRAKVLPPPDNTLFEACFRIQREACEAAGRHIPLIVENVRGAQKWVGRAKWNFGSYYLWGDVPALMPMTQKSHKVPGFRFDGSGKSFQSASVEHTGYKSSGMNWSDRTRRGQDFTRIAGRQAMEGCKGLPHRTKGHWTNPAEHEDTGTKIGGDWFSDPESTCRRHGSKSKGRRMASAMIAKIPLPLSRHIAAIFKPVTGNVPPPRRTNG